MTELKTVVAAMVANEPLSLLELLRRLHQRGRLQPWLREAAVEEILNQQAAKAGLTVADEELQQAADLFRRRQGLNSAQQTQAWLQRQRLTREDFETVLERDLLIDKLRDHLTKDCLAGHFEEHRAEYDRVRLRQIVVAREDLARELLHQIQDEGRDFAELAWRHSQHPSRGEAVGEVMRGQLSASVAETVFAAQAGEIIGPLATPQGFLLLLVEEVRPAELDAQTAAAIRQQLFESWFNEQLQGVAITFPLLDAL